MRQIKQFSTEKIESLFLNDANLPVTGEIPLIQIRRHSDNRYFNGVGAFSVSSTSLMMSEIDESSQPGQYQYEFDTTGLIDSVYTMTTRLTGASNSPQVGELEVGGYVDDIGKTQGGGSVIHLEGVFTNKEKQRLMKMIADSFEQLNIVVNGLSSDLVKITRRINNVESKLDRDDINSKIEEMQNYMNIQTRLIEAVNEENKLIGEIDG